jgi:glycosyltransferase involved in cell wall biosynthesis
MNSQAPTVSFIVPCFKLAHLLSECVTSILNQTYRDFEILIMDDCSPDDTALVARSFNDERVVHVRNDPNLGHLKNYNKGIELARGKYIWLISADDYLRRSYVLEKYVHVLERHPNVGYAYCDGVGVRDGIETGTLTREVHGDRDRVMPGHEFLKVLLKWNSVLAASGIVRRECYEKVSVFPLDMPWAGDWYLWAMFALYYDVAYVAEPMVCYRVHELSMTTKLTRDKLEACAREEISIPWAIKKRAMEAHYVALRNPCLSAIAHTYVRIIGSELFRNSSSFMNFDYFEDSLNSNTTDEEERRWIRSRVYAGVGNECYWRDERDEAKRLYASALRLDPSRVSVRAKAWLLSSGRVGDFVRRKARAGSQRRDARQR